MASTAVRSKAAVLLLFILRLLFLPLLVGNCVRSLFCYAVLSILSSFAIMSLGKRDIKKTLKVKQLVLCLCLTVAVCICGISWSY